METVQISRGIGLGKTTNGRLQAAVLFSATKRIFFTDASRGTKNICFTNASNLIGVFNTVVPSRFPPASTFQA
jgi:hypothetical protein